MNKDLHRKARIIALAALCGLSQQSVAQDTRFKNAPVISPAPDVNGVDMASGTLMLASPFSFNAPAAGRLNYRMTFNGRRLTSTLNTYIDDETYTPYSYDPTLRRLRVHVGGADKYFKCHTAATCTQQLENDGSSLVRVATDQYVFTDRDGTIYSFFPAAYEQVPTQCDDPYDCNWAGYSFSAYVSEIKHPNGEKLVFQPTPVVSQGMMTQTVISNLGYKLEFKFPYSLNPPNLTSSTWLAHRSGLDASLEATLFQGNTQIRKISTTWVWSNNYQDVLITQTDDLSRQYKVNMHADQIAGCNVLDSTNHRPVTVTSPANVVTTATYHTTLPSPAQPGQDSLMKNLVPVKTVSRGGRTWNYDWRPLGKTATSPLGNTRSVDIGWISSPFDEPYSSCNVSISYFSPRITRSTDGLSRQQNYVYDANNGYRLASTTLPESNGLTYEHDARGNLKKVTQIAKPGSNLGNRVIYEAGYDATCTSPASCNKPNWTKDAKGNQTDYTYSTVHGGTLTVTLPAQPNGVRPKQEFTYTAHDTGNGILYRQTQGSQCTTGTSCTNMLQEERSVVSYWNNTFLPSSSTKRSGDGAVTSTVSYSYDNAGNVSQTTDPNSNVTAYFYDIAGRRTGEIGADPDAGGALLHPAIRTVYNNDDRVLKIEKGTAAGQAASNFASMTVLSTDETIYDTTGRKVQERLVVSSVVEDVTQFSYDNDDRPLCTAVRMNATTLASPPSDACLLGTAGADGHDRITRNNYDAAGQLLKVQKAYQTSLQQDYTTYTYSSNGRQLSATDAKGNRSGYTYNGYDELTHLNFPSPTVANTSSSTDYEQYWYDANGNRTRLRKRDGTLTDFTFDALNRMTQTVYPSGTATVNVTHDNRGLVLTGTSSVQSISNSYDALGRMLTTTAGGRVVSYQYDAIGNRTRVTWPDNVYVSYEYDARNRPKLIRENGSTILATYGYDNLGRSTGVSLGNGTVTALTFHPDSLPSGLTHDVAGTGSDVSYFLTYNQDKQVTGLTTSNIRYTPLQVPQTATYVANGLNQYTSVAGAAVSYDANGNLTGASGWTYGYDAVNRLVSASGSGISATYAYDATGRRVSKTVNGAATTFLYDGGTLIAEYAASGALSRRYVFGPGIDIPLVEYVGSSTSSKFWLYTNWQGSIVARGDSAGGVALADSFRYGPYGETTGAGPLFRYTGQVYDSETGLYHYKARAYSPTLGRFLQTDPVGYADDINLYAYTGNDPVNMADPEGEFAWMAAGALIGAGSDYALQVGMNLMAGQSLTDAATNIDGTSIAISAAMGAVGQFGTSKFVTSAVSKAGIHTKGAIGEAAAKAGIAMRRESIVASKASAKSIAELKSTSMSRSAGRSKPDFVVRDRQGNIKVVEAKFGEARLSNGQRDLQKAMGSENYTVSRTTASEVGDAAGAVAAVTAPVACRVVSAVQGPGNSQDKTEVCN